MVFPGQQIPAGLGAAEFLMGAVIDQSLVETGHTGYMFVDDPDVMGDKDDGDTLVLVQAVEYLIKMIVCLGVYSGCRLVQEKESRTVDKGAGDEDTLLLSSG